MKLEDLRKDVTKMSTDELYALLLDVRKERRTAGRELVDKASKKTELSTDFLKSLLEDDVTESDEDADIDLDELTNLLNEDTINET